MANETYTTTNNRVPLGVSTSDAGRSSSPDLSLDALLASERNYSSLMRRHAYERLDEGSMARANPPFDMGAAGRLTSMHESKNGLDNRILRGYIRRASSSGADPTAGYRLYFMFNPETIQRNYVAYLDQQALDPFSTIYGSNNLVAPPGILDFSFDLMFDRQTENANGSMPRGVLEDFDYFDLVVRGVVPEAGAPQMQDNGIMMVNPRNITVVFSPKLSVQGRPYSATVTYEKFDHNMRPIRMKIHLAMKAFYFGPVRQDYTYEVANSTEVYAATIPYDENITYTATAEQIKAATLKLGSSTLEAILRNASTDAGTADAAQTISDVGNLSSAPNNAIRLAALNRARELEGKGVQYVPGGRQGLTGVDCSGLVQWAYQSIGCYDAVGYGQTSSLINYAREHGTLVAEGPFNRGLTDDQVRSAQKGDLIVSEWGNGGISDHVVFVDELLDENNLQCFDSIPSSYGNIPSGPATRQYSIRGATWSMTNYDYIIRPGIAGNDSVNGNMLGLRV